MIPEYGAVTQALLGTLLTWGLTAAGAGCVFFIRGKHVCDFTIMLRTTLTYLWKYLQCNDCIKLPVQFV